MREVCPVTPDQVWFEVHDDAKYELRGLKFLRLDLMSLCRGVVDKGRTPAEGVALVFEAVKGEVEDLVGPLMTPELKLIKKVLDSRRRVNRCFDLLGVAYSDWPSPEASGSEAGVKRKRGSAGGRDGGAPKQGRGGRGRGSSVDRPVVAKVSQSRWSVPKPKPVAPVAPAPVSSRHPRAIPGLGSVPLVDVESDDDDEDEERVADDVEEKVEGDSSNGSGDDGDDEDGGDQEHEEEDVEGSVRDASQELGFDGSGFAGSQELARDVASHPAAAASRFKRCRVHIFENGDEVATEDDEPGRGSGKHELGDANRSGLVHYALECGTDDPEIDLYTSPDLRSCHLVGNNEERRFLGGVFRRTSIPEAEFMLSHQRMDDLTRDIEDAGVRALLLARGARIRHGHAMTELKERLASAEEQEKGLKAANDTLSQRVRAANDKKVPRLPGA